MRVFCILTVLLSVLLINTPTCADTTYTVKKGDNLYRISKKFKIGIEDIGKANDLASDKLMPGAELIIPSLQPHIETENKTYEVKKGDSLWKIAKRYSTSVAELKALNNRKSSRLKPGQILILEQKPVEAEAEADIKPATNPESDPKSAEAIREISETPEALNSQSKEFLISLAQQTIGIPYKFGSNSSKATDCSGYVQMVFGLLGIDLPRSAREQFKLGASVDRKDLSVGDLVFFQTYARFPSHVGIYLGNNLFIHASSFAKKVTIESLNVPYYLKRFIGAKRLPGLDELSGGHFYK